MSEEDIKIEIEKINNIKNGEQNKTKEKENKEGDEEEEEKEKEN